MEKLTVSDLISGTIATVEANLRTAAMFVALLTAVGTALEWGLSSGVAALPSDLAFADTLFAVLGVSAGIGGIGLLIVFVVAQYLLWQAMIDGGELFARRERPVRVLAFIGIAILTLLGTFVGLMLLIVPGLLVGARWAIAPGFLIDRDQGVIESLSSSWDAVKGNSTPIILTYIVGLLAVMVAGSLVGGVGLITMDSEGPGLFAIGLSQLINHAGTVLQVAFAVHVYHRLVGREVTVASVFD